MIFLDLFYDNFSNLWLEVLKSFVVSMQPVGIILCMPAIAAYFNRRECCSVCNQTILLLICHLDCLDALVGRTPASNA